MKILFTAFNGKTNTSKLLLDKINASHKLYLKNSHTTSAIQLENELKKNDYDLIISIGQAPRLKDSIKIEETGASRVSDIKYKTNYDYTSMKKNMKNKGYRVIISNNAGRFICNSLYFNGLKYIYENNLKTKMIFIHIPKIKNITNIDNMASIFDEENF